MQGVSKMRLQTKACIAGLKTLLMMFNFIFWATGIILAILGLWMKFSLGRYFEISSKYASFGVGGLFAFVGVVIIITSFLACSCTSKGQTGLLYIYGGFLFVLFIVILSGAIAGYVYRGNLSGNFHDGLKAALDSYGQKSAWLDKDVDKMQQFFECCGTNNYTDWFNTSFADNATINAVPGSCCPGRSNCAPKFIVTEETIAAIYQRGCFDQTVDYLSAKLKTVGELGLIVAFVQLFGGFLALLLAKYINKAVYETLN